MITILPWCLPFICFQSSVTSFLFYYLQLSLSTLINLKSHLAAKEASTPILTNLIGLALSIRTSVPKKTVLISVLKYISFMLYLSELLVISYCQDNFGPFKPYVINSLHMLNTWKPAILQFYSYLNNLEKANLKLHPKKLLYSSQYSRVLILTVHPPLRNLTFSAMTFKINDLCLCRPSFRWDSVSAIIL